MSESKSLTRGQWFVLAAAFLGWMFDGVEIGLFPLVARPALQDLLKVSDEAQVAVVDQRDRGLLFGGAAIGGVSFGWLGDKIGRVRGMVICMLMYSFFTGACYFATAPWQLGLFLFLASLGMGGAVVAGAWPW